MERGIKYDDHRNAVAEYFLTAADRLNMTGVMQRSQRDQALDTRDDLVGNKLGITEQRAALDDTVTDRGNLVKVLDNTLAIICSVSMSIS